MKHKLFFSLAALILFITLPGLLFPADDSQPVAGTVKSADGIPIRYDVWGTDT